MMTQDEKTLKNDQQEKLKTVAEGQHASKIPSFTQIIEADHFTIEILAAKLRNPEITAAIRNELIIEVVWRLFRHDVSEQLVMRPAFEKYMGVKGAEMAKHDREDHNRAKLQLTALLNTAASNDKDQENSIRATINEVFDDLEQHMRIESGQMLPRFAQSLAQETSHELSRQYARTLVLTPKVSRIQHDCPLTDRISCFQSVDEFLAATVEDHVRILQALEQEAKHDPSYFDQMMEKELHDLRVGKWKAHKSRKNLHSKV